MRKSGFTLIEVLIVVSIMAILSVTLMVSVSKQRTKAEDVSMKSDLSQLKVAFEDYYNDHNCYPPSANYVDALTPYLKQMLINKKTNEPYVLEKDTTGCKWFKIYTTLNNTDDPDSVKLRTTDPLVGSTLGNYGVSSSNVIISIYYNPTSSTTPTPTPTPTSTPIPTYYCQGVGNCSSIPAGLTCSPSYSDPNCTGSNMCATTISTCQ